MKIIQAVKPFIYKDNSNFKLAVYKAWREAGGQICSERPYEKYYQSLSYHLHMPTICQNKTVARLRFVEAANLLFDTFPDYLLYEIIPVIWDCWPRYHVSIAEWIRKHKVRIVFLTSAQAVKIIRGLCPYTSIIHLPEAIDTNLYKEGKLLSERLYDYLEFGRCCNYINTETFSNEIRILSSRNEKGTLTTRAKLIDALADSKVTLCIPRSVNQPEIAEGIETLTQRYWECMLSRIVMVGHAPEELIDIIGYNPVIEMDFDNPVMQITDILTHIEDYQELVDKNRAYALKYGDWKLRVRDVMIFLEECGYKV